MKDVLRLKAWAGPLTMGTFVVMTVTGVLMFFHLNVGMVKLLHEWLSWLFVAGAVAHLAVNWGPFLAYWRKPFAVGMMATLLVIGALALLPLGSRGSRPPFMAALRSLEQSSLSVVAQVAKRSPEAVMEELTKQGLRVRDATQTISAIATDNDKPSLEILACVLGDAGLQSRVVGSH